MLKKTFISSLLIAFLVILSGGLAQAGTVTIATFADPAADGTTPLFTVDFNNMTLNGGWADDKTGLILEIPYSGYTIDIGNAFENAWFDMTEVAITNTTTIFGALFGVTGSGEINFYEDNNSTDPLVVIDFESGLVSQYSFGADEIFTAENVTITGSKITGTLSEEKFTFGFANLAHLAGSTDWNDGFTATAAFTSSAVPEPATIALLGLGSLILVRRKHRA